MGRLLFVIFMAVPLIEIAFFIVIGNAIGLWPTLFGVVLTAIVGSLLLRHQGLALWREIQTATSRGQLPARALADAMMVSVAGVLMITPGYFTDLLGILLMIPPVRTLIYAYLRTRLTVVGASAFSSSTEQSATIDLETDKWRPD
jgi:UPF0716 protein FxsA